MSDELNVLDNLTPEQEERIKRSLAEREAIHKKAEERKRFEAALARWERVCDSLQEAYEVELASAPEDVRMRGRLQAAIGRYERLWRYATGRCGAKPAMPFWMAAAAVAAGPRYGKVRGRKDAFRVVSALPDGVDGRWLRSSSCAVLTLGKPFVIGSIKFDDSMAVEVIRFDKKAGRHTLLHSEGFNGLPKGVRWDESVRGFDNLARLVTAEEWAKHLHAMKAREGEGPGSTKGWAYLPKIPKVDLEAMADALFGPLSRLPKRPEYPAKPIEP